MARYESEMLSFEYSASLHIRHPSQSLEDIAERLGLPTNNMRMNSHRAGESRRTPRGAVLEGNYSEHYWRCDLPTADEQDITEFLRMTVLRLMPHREFLCRIAETGGEVCIFIGIGNSRCCAHQFERQLLADLVATGLDLRLDFYGSHCG